MREIKFRAWLKDEKKMVEVEEISFLGQKQIAYDEIVGIHSLHYTLWVDLEDIELMQYTGLKDNNGVEIYEGDIVKCYYDLYIVKFQNSSFQFCPICQTCRNKVAYIFSDGAVKSSCEVIGNIYDNPNLLQIKK